MSGEWLWRLGTEVVPAEAARAGSVPARPLLRRRADADPIDEIPLNGGQDSTTSTRLGAYAPHRPDGG
jgi:hypothetical protein